MMLGTCHGNRHGHMVPHFEIMHVLVMLCENMIELCLCALLNGMGALSMELDEALHEGLMGACRAGILVHRHVQVVLQAL